MPLKWQRGVNPYRYNYFGKLHIGPHFRPPQLLEQARNLIQKLTGGEPIELPGPPLDEHAINEAVSKLREPRSLAEELLLVHAVGPKTKNRLRSVISDLQAVAVLPSERDPLELVGPATVFCLVGPPGAEAAAFPELSAFGFVQPGDEQDLQLDIVFDI
jgi:hypothetical protein